MGRGQRTSDETIERIKATYALEGDIAKTSAATGVPETTVRKYIDPKLKNQFAEVRAEKMAEVIPKIISRIEETEFDLLKAIKLRAATGEDSTRDLATAFGILRDKHLLITGQPNARIHNTTDAYSQLTTEEMEQAALIRERFANAERVPA